MQYWLGTQLFIAKELGIKPEQWMDYIEWALQNPMDFSFTGPIGSPKKRARIASPGDVKKATEFVGGLKETVQPGGGGPSNFAAALAAIAIDKKKSKEK